MPCTRTTVVPWEFGDEYGDLSALLSRQRDGNLAYAAARAFGRHTCSEFRISRCKNRPFDFGGYAAISGYVLGEKRMIDTAGVQLRRRRDLHRSLKNLDCRWMTMRPRWSVTCSSGAPSNEDALAIVFYIDILVYMYARQGVTRSFPFFLNVLRNVITTFSRFFYRRKTFRCAVVLFNSFRYDRYFLNI